MTSLMQREFPFAVILRCCQFALKHFQPNELQDATQLLQRHLHNSMKLCDNFSSSIKSWNESVATFVNGGWHLLSERICLPSVTVGCVVYTVTPYIIEDVTSKLKEINILYRNLFAELQKMKTTFKNIASY